jgi:hypothetical protein
VPQDVWIHLEPARDKQHAEAEIGEEAHNNSGMHPSKNWQAKMIAPMTISRMTPGYRQAWELRRNAGGDRNRERDDD